MVAHEKRNSAQLFWAVPTQNYSVLSFLFFSPPTHTKVGIAVGYSFIDKKRRI